MVGICFQSSDLTGCRLVARVDEKAADALAEGLRWQDVVRPFGQASQAWVEQSLGHGGHHFVARAPMRILDSEVRLETVWELAESLGQVHLDRRICPWWQLERLIFTSNSMEGKVSST